MKIRAKELVKGLREVRRGKPDKYMPIVNSVRLACGDGVLIVTTTDREGKQTTARVPAIVEPGETWTTCAPMITPARRRPLEDYARVCAAYDDTLTLELQAHLQYLRITNGPSRTVFKCLDAQEWPAPK